MRFEPTMKQAVVRRTVRKFAEEKLAAAAMEMDRSAAFPAGLATQMGGLHYFGLEIPHEYGGAGLDGVSSAMVIEEVSRANAAMGLCVSVHNSVSAWPVYRFGTEDQKRRFLGPMASGQMIGTFCLTEPNAGSDVSSLETTGVLEGDTYVINGDKVFVTNGGASGINLVFGVTRSGDGKKAYTVFIVESEREGVFKGPPEDLMGMRGNPVCAISFHDCRVPVENRLGEEGHGLRIALSTLGGGRIGIGAQALGIAQGGLDLSVRYVKERHQFGRPLAELGAIQGYLADMATRVEASRLMIYRASHLRDLGHEHTAASAMAKLYASDAAVYVTRMGVQIHGGYGYTRAYPIERLYRDAKVCEIYEGTSEVQRIVIARSLLGA